MKQASVSLKSYYITKEPEKNRRHQYTLPYILHASMASLWWCAIANQYRMSGLCNIAARVGMDTELQISGDCLATATMSITETHFHVCRHFAKIFQTPLSEYSMGSRFRDLLAFVVYFWFRRIARGATKTLVSISWIYLPLLFLLSNIYLEFRHL